MPDRMDLVWSGVVCRGRGRHRRRRRAVRDAMPDRVGMTTASFLDEAEVTHRGHCPDCPDRGVPVVNKGVSATATKTWI